MAFDRDDVALAARIKALGHPARLAIVRALSRVDVAGQCCGDLVVDLPLAQSTVSQHLKILRDAGLIHGVVAGPRCCYRLDRAALAAVAGAMQGLSSPVAPLVHESSAG